MKKCVPFLLLLCSAITSTGAQGILSDESDTPQTVFIHGKPDILNQATRLKDSMQNGLPHLCQMPDKYFNKVSAKAHKLTQRLTKRTKKALHRLQKQEEKINSKLSKIDSVAAHNLLSRSIDSLSHLQGLVKGRISNITSKIPSGQYIPYLDSLSTSLNFLSTYTGKLSQIKDIQQKVQSTLGSVHQLEGKLNQVQDIQQYIQQRQQLLKQTLSGDDLLEGQFGKVFQKYLRRYEKEAYYYKAQLANYKGIWQHPDQIEAKAMQILEKVPAFNSFMKEHSMLAGLFSIPADYGSAQSLQGLQTRAMVEREIQQRLQQAGSTGQQQIQQQMAMAKQKLQELKDKLPGGGSVADMPDFKPKDLKSKTLFQRLEYGANVQFGKANGFYPTTSDLAAQVAYKFSDKGSAGIGTAFKLGWGTNIRKIHFTAQGLGLRSFLDYNLSALWQKLKGTFYVNGGFEFNYTKTTPDIPSLRELNGWTKSALLGIERKYKISDKVNGNMMLLFDFLYKQHVPQTQPLVFRVGYNF